MTATKVLKIFYMEAKESKFNIAETIRNIKTAREELAKAVKAEKEACAPMLTDKSRLPRIYEIFREIRGSQCETTESRDMFVFIAMYLYTPRSFFWHSMWPGTRKEIARVIGIKSRSVISRSAKKVLHHYRVYHSFREEINRIFESMIERMRVEEII